jgi:hypothetical protein
MQRRYGDRTMKLTPKALIGQGRNNRVVIGALLTAGAIGGWAISAMFTPSAAAVEGLTRRGDIPSLEEAKPSLVGSYVVSGTDPDGRSYANNGVVDISLAPSGASSSNGTTASR